MSAQPEPQAQSLSPLEAFAAKLARARGMMARRAEVVTPLPANHAAKAQSTAPLGENMLEDRGTASKYRVTAAIPSGARATGDLLLEESAILGGAIDGNLTITGKGMAVFIKQGGVVRGGVKAAVVLVYGEVYGRIEADYLRIYPGGRVEGSVVAEAMMVEKGALLLNDCMQIAPPITAALNAMDANFKAAVRPASSAETKELDDALIGIQRVGAG